MSQLNIPLGHIKFYTKIRAWDGYMTMGMDESDFLVECCTSRLPEKFNITGIDQAAYMELKEVRYENDLVTMTRYESTNKITARDGEYIVSFCIYKD